MEDPLIRIYDELMACLDRTKMINEELKNLEAQRNELDPAVFKHKFKMLKRQADMLNRDKERIGRELEELGPAPDDDEF